ncbi:MAG: NAD(P)-dependent oxidoreductase, partial [Verrucomicrobiaceae bacterium]|nr:NAD(P)-dependent oxidoreductase [Verrucomicrobiaceae bacterium]
MNDPRPTALIGHTGFVGANLGKQRGYQQHFNSRNIADIVGQSFDTVVCAGVGAVKWKANKEPEADWTGIQALLKPLATVQARRFILISTIDVYANPDRVTEDDAPSEDNHAYGRHRLKIEQFIAARFPVHHIIRLPGLFGDGLKKNVIYDLLHENCLEMIQPASAFQYYNLDHLTADLDKAVAHDLRVL